MITVRNRYFLGKLKSSMVCPVYDCLVVYGRSLYYNFHNNFHLHLVFRWPLYPWFFIKVCIVLINSPSKRGNVIFLVVKIALQRSNQVVLSLLKRWIIGFFFLAFSNVENDRFTRFFVTKILKCSRPKSSLNFGCSLKYSHFRFFSRENNARIIF